jgi:AraC-like DNA-binding protein
LRSIVAYIPQETIRRLKTSQSGCKYSYDAVGFRDAEKIDPNERMSLAAFATMLEVAAYEQSNETLGLELGRNMGFINSGRLKPLIESADTLGIALEKFVKYFSVVQTSTRNTLTISNGVARLSYVITDPAVRFRTQDAAYTIAQHRAMIRDLVGGKLAVSGVHFEFAAGQSADRYTRNFGAPVQFECRENAILFPARALEHPIMTADRKVHSKKEQEIARAVRRKEEQLALGESVKEWVTASVSVGAPTNIEHIASDFGISPRSLRRKLAEDGRTYHQIRDHARLEMAKSFLSKTLQPITSIAGQLGYSETSAFCRSFKAQSGFTPAEFRRDGPHRT